MFTNLFNYVCSKCQRERERERERETETEREREREGERERGVYRIKRTIFADVFAIISPNGCRGWGKGAKPNPKGFLPKRASSTD